MVEPDEDTTNDIDPNRVDVLLSKPKKTRKRKKPPLPEKLRPYAVEARKRAERRPLSPGVLVEPVGDHGIKYEPFHKDWEAWELQIADAFGTRSHSTIYTFLEQLSQLSTNTWDKKNQRWKPDEQELNFALNFVSGIRPKNEAEAALAAQMVAVHMLTMRVASYQLGRHGWVDPKSAAMAGKLARTFAMQLDTLNRLRGKGRTKQTISVKKENHVHVHRHAHVHQGASETERRAHERSERGVQRLAPADGSETVRGEESDGRVVPLSRHAR